jgi:hypothetical protein
LQNSITYGSLRGAVPDPPVRLRCGQETGQDFTPGHDLKAIQARTRERFGGSALALIEWIDKARPDPGN